MPRIQAPDSTLIDFPDSMNDAQIEAAMGKLFPKPVPGMEKLGGQPPPTKLSENPITSGLAPKPEALKTNEEAQNFWTSPRGLIRGGLSRMAEAVPALAAHDPAKATSDLIQGAGSVMTPAAIPLALAAPVPALGAFAGGYAGSKGGGALARHFNAPENVTQAAEDVGSTVGGAAGGGTLGALSRRIAPSIANSALSIPGRAKAYGANPGKAALEETTGVKPSTIARSASGEIKTLGQELEARAASTPTLGSLRPARAIANTDSATAAARNSTATPNELVPLQRFLTEPTDTFSGRTEYPAGSHTPISYQTKPSPLVGPSGQPIPGPTQVVSGQAPPLSVAEDQPASSLLGMRRQLNQDFVRNWNPAVSSKGALGTARRTYGALGNELDRIVPGGKELDQRISSLVPVAERARLTDLGAGPGERAFNRIARPTGGLAPLLFGYHEGGVPGALASLVGQETLSSPTAKMILARRLYRPLNPFVAGALGEKAGQ